MTYIQTYLEDDDYSNEEDFPDLADQLAGYKSMFLTYTYFFFFNFHLQ